MICFDGETTRDGADYLFELAQSLYVINQDFNIKKTNLDDYFRHYCAALAYDLESCTAQTF